MTGRYTVIWEGSRSGRQNIGGINKAHLLKRIGDGQQIRDGIGDGVFPHLRSCSMAVPE